MSARLTVLGSRAPLPIKTRDRFPIPPFRSRPGGSPRSCHQSTTEDKHISCASKRPFSKGACRQYDEGVQDFKSTSPTSKVGRYTETPPPPRPTFYGLCKCR